MVTPKYAANSNVQKHPAEKVKAFAIRMPDSHDNAAGVLFLCLIRDSISSWNGSKVVDCLTCE